MPRHPRDAFAREMSRVRGTPQESAEHDGLRRHRDPRLSVRTLQVLDGPKASRAHAVRIHPEVLMRVRYEGGFLVQDLLKEVILDPVRKTPGSVATHGHMAHLTTGGIMTPQTPDAPKVPRGATGQALPPAKAMH